MTSLILAAIERLIFFSDGNIEDTQPRTIDKYCGVAYWLLTC